jgi:hypothetical protein
LVKSVRIWLVRYFQLIWQLNKLWLRVILKKLRPMLVKVVFSCTSLILLVVEAIQKFSSTSLIICIIIKVLSESMIEPLVSVDMWIIIVSFS